MKNLLIIFFALAAISCNHIYKEYDKESFPTYSWARGQEIIFTPEITNTTKTYSLLFGLRHLYGLQLKNLVVSIKTITPSGKETTKQYEINLIDDNNNYISSCGGDLCDIETVVEESITYNENGKYTYVITHNSRVDKVPGIMEVGLIIDMKD